MTIWLLVVALFLLGELAKGSTTGRIEKLRFRCFLADDECITSSGSRTAMPVEKNRPRGRVQSLKMTGDNCRWGKAAAWKSKIVICEAVNPFPKVAPPRDQVLGAWRGEPALPEWGS